MKPAVFQPPCSLVVNFVQQPKFCSFSMFNSTLGSPATLLRDAGRIQPPLLRNRKTLSQLPTKAGEQVIFPFKLTLQEKILNIFNVFKLKIGGEYKHAFDPLLKKRLKHMQVQLLPVFFDSSKMFCPSGHWLPPQETKCSTVKSWNTNRAQGTGGKRDRDQLDFKSIYITSAKKHKF